MYKLQTCSCAVTVIYTTCQIVNKINLYICIDETKYILKEGSIIDCKYNRKELIL